MQLWHCFANSSEIFTFKENFSLNIRDEILGIYCYTIIVFMFDQSLLQSHIPTICRQQTYSFSNHNASICMPPLRWLSTHCVNIFELVTTQCKHELSFSLWMVDVCTCNHIQMAILYLLAGEVLFMMMCLHLPTD